MNGPKDFDSPTTGMSISARIDLVCDEFEEMWNRAIAGDVDQPRIEDYIERGPTARRDKLFRELLEIEIEIRLSQKESFDANEYIKRFPEQGEVIRAVAGQMIKTRLLGDYELLEQLGSGGMG